MPGQVYTNKNDSNNQKLTSKTKHFHANIKQISLLPMTLPIIL